MNHRTLIASCLSLSLLACGASPANDEADGDGTDHRETAASMTSQSELGVSSWVLDASDGQVALQGKDSDGEARAGLSVHAADDSDGTHWIVVQRTIDTGAWFGFRVDSSGNLQTTAMKNVTGHPEAWKMLRDAIADLRGGAPAVSESTTTAQSLRPLGGPCGLVSCDPRSLTTGGSSAVACVSAAGDALLASTMAGPTKATQSEQTCQHYVGP